MKLLIDQNSSRNHLSYTTKTTVSAISKELRIPEGTVKWHLHKARNELKEGIEMERKIGKLGLKPIKANNNIGHSGIPGRNGGPEYYLNDHLNLNIVYSVYYIPKTAEEISEELGVTPVFIEDRIELLENNRFLVGQPETDSHMLNLTGDLFFGTEGNVLKMRLQAAEILRRLCGAVRAAIAMSKTSIYPRQPRTPEAAVVFTEWQQVSYSRRKDLSKY